MTRIKDIQGIMGIVTFGTILAIAYHSAKAGLNKEQIRSLVTTAAKNLNETMEELVREGDDECPCHDCSWNDNGHCIILGDDLLTFGEDCPYRSE